MKRESGATNLRPFCPSPRAPTSKTSVDGRGVIQAYMLEARTCGIPSQHAQPSHLGIGKAKGAVLPNARSEPQGNHNTPRFAFSMPQNHAMAGNPRGHLIRQASLLSVACPKGLAVPASRKPQASSTSRRPPLKARTHHLCCLFNHPSLKSSLLAQGPSSALALQAFSSFLFFNLLFVCVLFTPFKVVVGVDKQEKKTAVSVFVDWSFIYEQPSGKTSPPCMN